MDIAPKIKMKNGTVSKYLAELVKSGDLVRVSRGNYAYATPTAH